MSRVLIVDWLGRGGIAQTTGAWAATLTAAGHEVLLASRPGRELQGPTLTATGSERSIGGRLRRHAAVVASARKAIASWQPDMVVIQNFVVPAMEYPVANDARRAGARVVHVVHDHQLHSPLAGTVWGLRRSLQAADEIWTHSHCVAETIATSACRPARVVPIPVPPSLLERPLPQSNVRQSSCRTAVHFGVLKRGYKGTSRVLELARSGVPGWRFQLLGTGAPTGIPGVESWPGFVSSNRLVAAIAGADATVLPYRLASQSGAVVLSQVLGTIPLVTAVGGIPEQIDHGIDGLLMAVQADRATWTTALVRLSQNPEHLAAMAAAGAHRAWDGHHAFQAAVRELAAA